MGESRAAPQTFAKLEDAWTPERSIYVGHIGLKRLNHARWQKSPEAVVMLVDTEVLEQLGMDTAPELVPRLINVFIGELRKRASAMDAADRDADIQRLARESHAMKSSAATYGAPELAIAAKKVDQACRDDDLPGAREGARTIQDLVEPTICALRAYIAEPTG